MTSFTGCAKTSLTLPRECSQRGGKTDALEVDGRTRAAGAVRGGRQSAGENDGGAVPRVRGFRDRWATSGSAAIAKAGWWRLPNPAGVPLRVRNEPWVGAVEQRVVDLRRRYPDWGARKLRVLLQRDGMELASNTIRRILLQRDLIHEEDRHQPAVARFEHGAPNELWQMDFRVPKVWHQRVGPLSVLDDHSRYFGVCWN